MHDGWWFKRAVLNEMQMGGVLILADIDQQVEYVVFRSLKSGKPFIFPSKCFLVMNETPMFVSSNK